MAPWPEGVGWAARVNPRDVVAGGTATLSFLKMPRPANGHATGSAATGSDPKPASCRERARIPLAGRIGYLRGDGSSRGRP